MNILNGILAILILLGAVACGTQVSETDAESATESQKSEDFPSGLELLENNSAKAIVSCTPQNSLKFVLAQNKNSRIVCRERTKLDPTRTVGPVCAGGAVITDFTSNTNWVDCEDLVVCGKKPKNIQELSSSSTTQMRQLQFSGLPWGCQGEVEFAIKTQVDTPDAVKKIAINITPPDCPLCSVSNTRTCEVCGTDTVSPEILDVFTESSTCNRIRTLVFAKDDNSGLHAEPYSFDGGVTWQTDSFQDKTGLTLNVPALQIWVRDRAGNIAKYSKALAATSSPCPCATPWGETVPHGQVLTAYKTPTVMCTTTCEANSQSRTCNNGVLSGTAEFGAKSCSVTGCPKCQLPWGAEIDHGVKVTAFNLSSAPCAGECKSTQLSCERGVLKGEASTHRFKACTFTRASCDCKHAGIVIANGQKRKVYATEEVNCGSTCQEGEVTCTSGELSGMTGYANVSCSPKICKCLSSWGQQVDLNQKISAYKDSTLSCEDTMVCDDPRNKIEIKCTDVIANKFEVIGTGKITDFTQPSCSATVCGCVHLGTVFKPTDPPLKVYKQDKATSPEKCEMTGIIGEVRCRASGKNFITSGDTNTTVFKHTQCQNVTGNASDYDVGAGDGGGANGGVGNDEGEGEGFRRRKKGGGGGDGCKVNEPPYYCYGASGGVSINRSFCFLPGQDGYTAPPTDKKITSQRVSPGGYITAFSQKEVACGDSCSKYMGIISCDHGVMSSKDKYKYLDCREVCP